MSAPNSTPALPTLTSAEFRAVLDLAGTATVTVAQSMALVPIVMRALALATSSRDIGAVGVSSREPLPEGNPTPPSE